MMKEKISQISPICSKKSLGSYGETLVATHMKAQGYTIISQNYRQRCGEIDLIIQKGNLIAFVEVKLRNKKTHCTTELINTRKQKKIIAAAHYYLADNPNEQVYRFDVALVDCAQTKPLITHIENAFYGTQW